MIPRNSRLIPNLEEVLQRELHDSRIAGSVDLAKDVAVKRRGWIHADEAVGHIERLASKFDTLSFPEPESPRQGHVLLPGSRAWDIGGPHISDPAQIRLCEGARIQVVGDGVPVAERVSEYLVPPLGTDLPI